MELEKLAELIKGRRSIRRWRDQEVPEDLLLRAVESATWAPNGANYQGWRFVIVTNREFILRMANTVQSVADKMVSWPEASRWERASKKYQKDASFFRTAPACVAVFIRRYKSVADKLLLSREAFDPEAMQIRDFRKFAPTDIQSAAAAITTLLMVFHAMGFGAVWLAAPLIAKKNLEEMLSAPEGMGLVSIVAVGYPDESPRRKRKAVSKVVEFIR